MQEIGRNWYRSLLFVALAACGTETTAPVADRPPEVTLGTVTGSGFAYTAEIVNVGGPGAFAVWPIQLTAAGTVKSPADCYTTSAASGQIDRNARRSVSVAIQCSSAARADLLVAYAGVGQSIRELSPVGCFALGATPCPSLASLRIP